MVESSNNSATAQSRPFGRRLERPVVTVRNHRGERSFTVSPISTFSLCVLTCVMVVGLCVSSAYLFLRDDLLGATIARSARMQHAYEDRISALRSKVDLITSRQLLDQQAVESRVGELMARQTELGERAAQMQAAMSRAARIVPQKLPELTPEQRSDVTGSIKPQASLSFGGLVGSTSPFADGTDRIDIDQDSLVARIKPDEALFNTIEASLQETEQQQFEELIGLKEEIDSKSIRLATILQRQGINVSANGATGGPLIELKSTGSFLDAIQALDESLAELERNRSHANKLPHGSPARGKSISSRFGGRKDPFTGRTAMHSGLDFRAQRGSPIRATAEGLVVKAGKNGGYGKMVEIDHGNGLTTRYAHMSRILVKKGDRVPRGYKIGKVGSTGRSTGPHLHYEVRRNGQSLNPIHYVRLGKFLKPYM